MADFDKAIAMAPKEGRYLYQRAMLRLANGERQAGRADLDQAIDMAPTSVDARLTRAGLRLRDGNRGGAGDDLAVADAALAPSSNLRYPLAGLYDNAGMPEKALASYDLWLKSHPDDSNRPGALNGRCWARGQLNRDLDKALDDCDAAIRAQPRNASFLDSRALVRLRRGELAKALADYDAAITIAPKNAWSLYARGIVEAKMGDAAKAKTDREAALAIAPGVAERAKRFGLEP
jgi:tetratricopeptide (TPR) repeat protein